MIHQIPAGVGSTPDFIENHKAGTVRVVAVMGKQRPAVIPEVPTLSELGIPGYEDVPYYGIFALLKTLGQPRVREWLRAMGLDVGLMIAQELNRRERAYTQTSTRIIRGSGLQPP